jgi:glycosyltransferase involved in cell wall biosynthesis
MLSIIIPTLNEEKYLPILLKSILNQSGSSVFEIIVADAGSSDETIEIAESFGCKIVKGGMPAKGRNEGAKIAKGEYLLFTDADNIYSQADFLENLITDFKKRSLDVASFSICPNGKKIDNIFYGIYNTFVNITQIPHGTNSILVKKEIYDIIGGFDEEIKIGEDHYFVKKAALHGKFGFIKTKPVMTSSRRLEKEGRLKTYAKYVLAGIYMSILGPIKTDIFKYSFKHLANNTCPDSKDGE